MKRLLLSGIIMLGIVMNLVGCSKGEHIGTAKYELNLSDEVILRTYLENDYDKKLDFDELEINYFEHDDEFIGYIASKDGEVIALGSINRDFYKTKYEKELTYITNIQ